MISNLRFTLWGIAGVVLLLIPFYQDIYPRIKRAAAIAEIESRKALPYDKPRRTTDIRLSEDFDNGFQYLVAMDTTFFFRDDRLTHLISEINFGKNYRKLYDTSKDEITYALLDEETKENVDAFPTLKGQPIRLYFRDKREDQEQEYYIREIYDILRSGKAIMDLSSPEKAPMDFKLIIHKNKWGRPLRNKAGEVITSLDTPKVVHFTTTHLDITKQ